MDQSRAGSKTRRIPEQSDPIIDKVGDSDYVGKKSGDQVMLPRTSRKARNFNSNTEGESHRPPQSDLFIKLPVQAHRQKEANNGSKPSLLSLKLRHEAMHTHQSRELTAQQRVSIADVFAPTAMDWDWRRGSKKSSIAEPVATILSINLESPSDRAESADSDESRYGEAAAPNRLSGHSARNSFRSSNTTEAKLSFLSSPRKKEVDLSQSVAIKALAALYDWVKPRPRVAETDVKDVRRQRSLLPRPARDNLNATTGSPDSVLVTQRLELPPVIAPIAVRRVTGFATAGGNVADDSLPAGNRASMDRQWRWAKRDNICGW